MAPTKKDLEPFRDDLTTWIRDGVSRSEIVLRLRQKHKYKISRSTLSREISRFELRQRVKTEDSPELRERIRSLFHSLRLSDDHMLKLLHHDGYQVSKRKLALIRREMGLVERQTGTKRNLDDDAVEAIRKELANGEIGNLSRDGMYARIRANHNVVGRDRIFRIARPAPPNTTGRRRPTLVTICRGQTSAPGPNYSWSIEGFDMLARFGIQMYAAVDIYSRYFVWHYVGVSSRCPNAIASRQVTALARTKKMPQHFQSNRHADMIIAADAHYTLSTFLRKRDDGQALQFTDCFEDSTCNEHGRIEAWWNQLSGGRDARWRDHFTRLESNGWYSAELLADRIACIALYVPIIRQELDEFVKLWNNHKIKKLGSRPDLAYGIPYMLFTLPELSKGEQCAVDLPEENIEPLCERVADFDAEEYLPAATLKWCKETLERLGFTSDMDLRHFEPSGIERRHLRAYLGLRDAINIHFRDNREPRLSELDASEQATPWVLSNEIQQLFSMGAVAEPAGEYAWQPNLAEPAEPVDPAILQ